MTGPLPPVLGNALPDFSLSGDQMGKIGNHSAQDTFFQRRWGEGGPGAPREEKGSRQLGRCRALPADIGLGPGHPAPPARRGRALDSGGDEPASVRASQLLHILEGEGDGPRGGVLGGYPVHELLQAHRHAAVPQDENPHCWPPSRPRPPRCSSSSYEAARGGGLPRDLSPAAVTCYSHITCARENPAPPGPPLPTGPAGGLGELAQVPL